MATERDCENCGATCSPSSSNCVFCKAPLSAESATKTHDEGIDSTLANILQFYQEGKVDKALSITHIVLKQRPEIERNLPFLLVHAKLLIESEGVTARIKTQLSKAYMISPNHPEVTE